MAGVATANFTKSFPEDACVFFDPVVYRTTSFDTFPASFANDFDGASIFRAEANEQTF
jgi:hypothetical protein